VLERDASGRRPRRRDRGGKSRVDTGHTRPGAGGSPADEVVSPAVWPARDARRPLELPTRGYFLSRVLYLGTALVGTLVPQPFFGYHWNRSLTAAISNWDGIWYLATAAHGYPSHVDPFHYSTVGFFPLYPILEWALGQALSLGYVRSGLIVSLAFGAVATIAPPVPRVCISAPLARIELKAERSARQSPRRSSGRPTRIGASGFGAIPGSATLKASKAEALQLQVCLQSKKKTIKGSCITVHGTVKALAATSKKAKGSSLRTWAWADVAGKTTTAVS